MSSDVFGSDAQRLKIASSDPQTLVRTAGFWMSQKALAALVAIAVLVGILFLLITVTGEIHYYSYFAIAIYLISFVGLFKTALILAEIMVERAIVSHIDDQCIVHVRDIRNKKMDPYELHKLEATFIPQTSAEPEPAMIRLFKNICHEAADRKFESAINAMQPFREESLASMVGIHGLQRAALQFGILGTFVGLILAIKHGLGPSFNTSDEIVTFLSMVLGDLHISFSTSIAGLSVALILGGALFTIRSQQGNYFREMETGVVSMLSVAYNAVNKDKFYQEFSRLNESLKVIETRLFTSSARVKDLSDRVNNQTEQISTGMDKLVVAKTNYDEFMTGLRDQQTAFIKEMQAVYEIASMKNLTKEIREGITEAGGGIAKTLEPSVSSISTRLEEFTKSADNLTEQVGAKSETVMDAVVKVSESVDNQTKEVNECFTSLAQTRSGMEAFMARLKGEQQTFIGEVKSSYELAGIRKLVAELNEEITRSGHSSERLRTNLDEILSRINRERLTIEEVPEEFESRSSKSWAQKFVAKVKRARA